MSVQRGTLSIKGTNTSSGGGGQTGVNIYQSAIQLGANANLSITGSSTNASATTAEYGVLTSGTIGQASGVTTAGNISIVGSSSSASNSYGVYLGSPVTTGSGNVTIESQNLGGSGAASLTLGGQVSSTSGNVTLQSIGGAINQTAGSISGKNVTIDNTGAGLTSLIADS